MKARKLSRVIIATDDKRILDVAKSFGADALLTSRDCASGTARVGEVAQRIKGDVFINVQGDEPLISPLTIDRVADCFIRDRDVVCVTAVYKTADTKKLKDAGVVKVVVDKNNDALYFSRSLIPFNRDKTARPTYFKHIGIYGYTRDFLRKLGQLKSPILEEIEKLEQLKILWHGYKIRCVETKYNSIGVDTHRDLKIVERFL